ncbi:MAG: hypothetical protein K1X57_22395 [Gemmataceae bacterium]|nr:hypothetical protein [Gemmataceae bacterium]
MVSENNLNRRIRDNIAAVMNSRGWDRAELRSKFEAIRRPMTESQLRRLISPEAAESRRSIPVYFLYLLSEICDVPISSLIGEPGTGSTSNDGMWIPAVHQNHRTYPDALLNATEGMANPIYTIVSSFPSSALLPRELVAYIYEHVFRFDHDACSNYQRMAQFVRRQYRGFDDDEVPRIVNYIPESAMRQLTSVDAIRIVSADRIMDFLDSLQARLRGSAPATIYLVNESLPANLDTQLVVRDRIASFRNNGNPGVSWSNEPDDMKTVEDLVARLRRGRCRLVDSTVIADFRQTVMKNAQRAIRT